MNDLQRIKCTISYDGTSFNGYQVQPDKRTVQQELEHALSRIHKGQAIKVVASGRTDTGVHARGQVIHFDTPLSIPVHKWTLALNANLPDDIVVNETEYVSNYFHARFGTKKKEYRYFVNLSKKRDVFNRNYMYHFPRSLNMSDIEEAAKDFIGTHDFTSFCSARSEVEDKVRTIYKIECIQEDDVLIFRFVGNGFLYNMVRILVGTLLQVGEGKISPSQMLELLNERNREHTGVTAPGNGLYLWEVSYNN
ncbi:tRNA pseudouridine(38-40) synthase TruA [Bacillus solimangrovi]